MVDEHLLSPVVEIRLRGLLLKKSITCSQKEIVAFHGLSLCFVIATLGT
jgi:hypothetical protein